MELAIPDKLETKSSATTPMTIAMSVAVTMGWSCSITMSMSVPMFMMSRGTVDLGVESGVIGMISDFTDTATGFNQGVLSLYRVTMARLLLVLDIPRVMIVYAVCVAIFGGVIVVLSVSTSSMATTISATVAISLVSMNVLMGVTAFAKYNSGKDDEKR